MPRIAHISDLHILDLTGVNWKRFLSRRIFGGINLLLKRAKLHKIEVLEKLIEDLIQEKPDHVVVTGDLSNLALETEFRRVLQYLSMLGGYEKVSVVPGNHDYYTHRAAQTRRFEQFFHPFMFLEGFSDVDVDLYPYVKKLGNIRIIGLNSACRTLPPLSYGTISERQLKALEEILSQPSHSAYTIVILHHALHRRDWLSEAISRLVNREALIRLLQKYDVDLVLYGHDHDGYVWWGKHRRPAFVCCGSSTRLTDDPLTVARYRLITIENRIIRVDTKAYDPVARRFYEVY